MDENNSEIGVKLDAKERLKIASISMKDNAKIKASGSNGERAKEETVNLDKVRNIIEEWPDLSKNAAERTIKTYGPPNEAIPSRLIWYYNGPWKRTIVYRDELRHNFPDPHVDVIQNFIDYKVPLDKYNEVAKFDGSVVIERTKGEVSSICDLEAANILALNLVHEISKGNMTAEQAREKLSEQTAAYVMNRPAPFADRLELEIPQKDTADPDEVTIGNNLMNQLKEKIKDVAE